MVERYTPNKVTETTDTCSDIEEISNDETLWDSIYMEADALIFIKSVPGGISWAGLRDLVR